MKLDYIKICLLNYLCRLCNTGEIMAVVRRFIAKSELRAGGICVWSTMRGGDSRSQLGPTTCWGNSPASGRIGSRANNRPDAHNIELEVTHDAHQEHSAGVGGGAGRRRHLSGGRSSDEEGGAGGVC